MPPNTYCPDNLTLYPYLPTYTAQTILLCIHTSRCILPRQSYTVPHFSTHTSQTILPCIHISQHILPRQSYPVSIPLNIYLPDNLTLYPHLPTHTAQTILPCIHTSQHILPNLTLYHTSQHILPRKSYPVSTPPNAYCPDNLTLHPHLSTPTAQTILPYIHTSQCILS